MSTDPTIKPVEPPLPHWVFQWIINPFMKLLLRSPLHRLVSDRLLLLTFTGYKSGQQFTTPLGYEQEEDTLIVLTRRPWWKNFQGGAPVQVRLRGETRPATATAVNDTAAIAAYIGRSLQRNPAEFNARRFGLTPGQERSPAMLEAAAEQQHMVQIKLKD